MYCSLVGCIICFLFFFAYLYYQIKVSDDEAHQAKIEKAQNKLIKTGEISLIEAFINEFSKDYGSTLDYKRMDTNPNQRFEKILRKFFDKYDTNGNGDLDQMELGRLFTDIGEKELAKPENMKQFLAKIDVNHDGNINFEEFKKAFLDEFKEQLKHKSQFYDPVIPSENEDINENQDEQQDGEEEDEEEPECPEEFKNLSPKQKLRKIMFKSLQMMSWGTFVVLVFSDPILY